MEIEYKKGEEICTEYIKDSCGYMLYADEIMYCKKDVVFNPDKTLLFEQYMNGVLDSLEGIVEICPVHKIKK